MFVNILITVLWICMFLDLFSWVVTVFFTNTFLFCILYYILVASAWFCVQFLVVFEDSPFCAVILEQRIEKKTLTVSSFVYCVFSSSSRNENWTIISYCTYFIAPGLYKNVLLFINIIRIAWENVLNATVMTKLFAPVINFNSINIRESTLCDP